MKNTKLLLLVIALALVPVACNEVSATLGPVLDKVEQKLAR